VDTSGYPSVFISHYNGHGLKSVRPLSIVDNTRDYANARVSHSRQWDNFNLFFVHLWPDAIAVIKTTALEQ